MEVLSEYFGDRPKATVRRTDHLYEVLWQGESVGSYQTEEEAEMVAENYALGSSISRT
jgi:hypothetical protein|tara:strand:+ start:138 stop:311 length:174 start_codon:yes stop_codon:yes gene_type:complete